MRGGDDIYAVIFAIFSVYFSYQLVIYYFKFKKSKYILSNSYSSNNKLLKKSNLILFNKYFKKLANKLFLLGNPYGMTLFKYIVLKYIISTIFLSIILYRFANFNLALLYFLLFFFMPDFLIYLFKKNESIKILTDIDSIVQSLILSLSINTTLAKAFKLSIKTPKYIRFKKEFENFVNDYILYNFNIISSSEIFSKKFDSYELKMFLSILIQSEKEGDMLGNLEAFSNTIDNSYYKKLKYKSSRRILYVSLATIISFINTILIVVYPIFMQISGNLSLIFK